MIIFHFYLKDLIWADVSKILLHVLCGKPLRMCCSFGWVIWEKCYSFMCWIWFMGVRRTYIWPQFNPILGPNLQIQSSIRAKNRISIPQSLGSPQFNPILDPQLQIQSSIRAKSRISMPQSLGPSCPMIYYLDRHFPMPIHHRTQSGGDYTGITC